MSLLEMTPFSPSQPCNFAYTGGMTVSTMAHRSVAGVTMGYAGAGSTTDGVGCGGSFHPQGGIPLPDGTYVMGRAVNYNPTLTWQRAFIVNGAAGGLRFRVGFEGSTRRWYVTDYSQATVTYSTLIQPNTNVFLWAYLEVKWTVSSGGNSTITVRLDGVEQVSVTTPVDDAQDMTTWNTRVTDGDGGQYWTIADQYLLDDTGSTNNDFLGDCRVECLATSSAGTLQESVPSSGTRLAAIQTTGGEYNTVDSTQIDTFVVDNLESTSGVIKGVAAAVNAAKGSGTVFVAAVARIGSTNHVSPTKRPVAAEDGARFSLGRETTYGIFDVSPDTASTWVASEVNGMELGYTVANSGSAI